MKWLVSIICVLVFPGLVQATVVQPSATDVSLMAGERASVEIWVENEELVPHTYSVDFFGVNFGDSIDELTLTPLSSLIQSWVTPNVTTFTLIPGERRAIEISLTPQTSQTAGVYPIAIVFSTRLSDETAITATSGISSLLFLTIEGDLTASARLDRVSLTQVNPSSLPVHIAATVTNTGERILKPEVTAEIRNVLGLRVGTIVLNPDSKRIPPETARTFAADWTGDGLARVFAFGPMEVNVTMTPVDGVAPSVTHQTFTVLPDILTLGVLGSVIIVTVFSVTRLVAWRRRIRL